MKTIYGYACVCNASYCDTISRPEALRPGRFHFYYMSDSSPGFNHKFGSFRMQAFPPHGLKIFVNESKVYQTIKGFGGAFTDSFGAALNTLSVETQEVLIRSIFSEDGIEYTVCRVALGSSDFSLRRYTYLPDYDPTLKSFNLTEDDFIYKIKHIIKALNVTKRGINLLAATWTPPNWMKNNNDSTTGNIKKEFLQLWADYQVKALEAYKDAGIEFWGITSGNEPVTLFAIHAFIPNLVMFPEQQRDWIIENLGPSLRRSGFDTKIIVLDDQRMYGLWWLNVLMRDPRAKDYIDGIGLHWYFDPTTSPVMLDMMHEKYSQVEMLYTESSVNPAVNAKIKFGNKLTKELFNVRFDPTPPNIGSWWRGILYMRSIIENLKHWVTSYVDWNMSLDLMGGPNFSNFSCDASIIINKTSDEFYKNPVYYVMGHFSKFMPPGSKIIDIKMVYNNNFDSGSEPPPPPLSQQPNANVTVGPFPTQAADVDVQFIGSLNEDGSKTIVFYNPLENNVEVSIHDPERGYAFLELERLSISSVIYW